MQVKCATCGSFTEKWPYEVKMYAKFYCSMKCRDITQMVECFNCKTIFRKKAKEIQNTKQNYCSRSCAAIQNNKNKRKDYENLICLTSNENNGYGYKLGFRINLGKFRNEVKWEVYKNGVVYIALENVPSVEYLINN